jgi:hypothetical protein
MATALTVRQQTALGLLFALSMILILPHSFASMEHLPGTIWAVFFIAGVFIRRARPFYAFCGLAACRT